MKLLLVEGLIVLAIGQIGCNDFYISDDIQCYLITGHGKPIEFRYEFGPKPAVLLDPLGRQYMVIGPRHEKFEVTHNGIIVTFRKPCILKAISESVDIEEGYVQYGGWMGIRSDKRSFVFDKDGRLSPR